MISFTTSGNTNKTDSFLDKMIHGDLYSTIGALAEKGVQALKDATPRDTGLTADSWSYEIEKTGSSTAIYWINTNTINGFNVVIGLKYGHGTGTGGWVAGEDFVSPAIKPIFDAIADGVWKEVTQA